MKQTSGMYTEMEWIKSDARQTSRIHRPEAGDDGKANRQTRGTEAVKMNSSEWQESVAKARGAVSQPRHVAASASLA